MDVRSEVPQPVKAAVEEVREHLVSLRGRGLFLSSADALLLVGWLDAGVAVPRILLALERAAEARRLRPSRIPLQLTHAKRHLGKPTAGLFAAERPAVDRAVPLGPVVRALAATPDSTGRDALEEALRSVGAGDAETLFRAASAAARRFLAARWSELAASERARLEQAAREELGELADLVDEGTLAELIDEGARAGLRAGYPALSAASLWEVAVAGADDGV